MSRSDPTTYFGLWSAKNVDRVCALLAELGVRYEVVRERVDQHVEAFPERTFRRVRG